MFSISNKKAFKIYLILRFVLLMVLLLLTFAYIITFVYKIDLALYLKNGSRTVVSLMIIDLILSPSFFQITISEEKLSVLYSQKNIGKLYFFSKKKQTTVLEVPIEEFNGYQITFRYFKLKKYLIIYKNNNGEVLKSDPIPITLINIQAYTNIIIQLDKITYKIRDFLF